MQLIRECSDTVAWAHWPVAWCWLKQCGIGVRDLISTKTKTKTKCRQGLIHQKSSPTFLTLHGISQHHLPPTSCIPPLLTISCILPLVIHWMSQLNTKAWRQLAVRQVRGQPTRARGQVGGDHKNLWTSPLQSNKHCLDWLTLSPSCRHYTFCQLLC